VKATAPLAPAAVVATTLTVPAACAGVVAVTWVPPAFTATPPAGTPSKVTLAPPRFAPESVTGVPPAVGPEAGEIEVSDGVAGVATEGWSLALPGKVSALISWILV